ncbi:hypothetical protein ACF0H5_014856 [Mactra antiquata]
MYIFAALRVDKGDGRSFCMIDPTQILPGYTRLVFDTDWLKKRPSKNYREQNEELMIKKPYLDFLDPCTSMYVNRNKFLQLLGNILQGEFHSPEMEKRFISYDVDDILQVSVLSYSHHGPALTVDRTALSSPSPSFSQYLEQDLKNGWLPQYFIPKINLISAISQKTIHSIVQDITKIVKYRL